MDFIDFMSLVCESVTVTFEWLLPPAKLYLQHIVIHHSTEIFSIT